MAKKRAAAEVLAARRHESATVLERAVCLTLRCHILGNHRKVRTGQVVEAAGGRMGGEGDEVVDERQLNTTKKLVDSRETTGCFRALGKAKEDLRRLAIPAHRVFGEGTYLIPVAAVALADKRLCERLAELKVEARLLRERWPAAVERQKGLLGPLYDEKQYPTLDEVERSWDLEWHYVSFQAPERLETVDKALYDTAREKHEARMAAAFEEVQLVLRESLRQVTSEIVRKLTPGPDGKVRTFKNSVLDGLAEFLETFEMRNITDDAELAAVVRKVRKLTKGVDPAQLRDMDKVRGQVAAEMKAVTARLDELVETRRRTIVFGNLDEAAS